MVQTRQIWCGGIFIRLHQAKTREGQGASGICQNNNKLWCRITTIETHSSGNNNASYNVLAVATIGLLEAETAHMYSETSNKLRLSLIGREGGKP